jgi:ParB family chromosome partitioning protein
VKRKALGRGLGALIPATATGAPPQDEGLVWLDLDQVLANPQQPRESFGEEELEELARSIQQNGVVQPVVVRREKTGYQLIAGERRWRAAQRAGLRKLPAIVRRVSDDRILDLALIENLLRQDLNPVEEARGFQKLIEEHGLTQEEVARRLGMKRTTISNSLRILKLPSEVLDMVRRGALSAGHAKVISGIPEPAEQARLAHEVERRGLSVRGLELLVARVQGKAAPGAARPAAAPRLDPNTLRAAENLTRALGTRARIERRANGGALVLEFYSEEELQRLYTLLMDAARLGRAHLKGGHA